MFSFPGSPSAPSGQTLPLVLLLLPLTDVNQRDTNSYYRCVCAFV